MIPLPVGSGVQALSAQVLSAQVLSAQVLSAQGSEGAFFDSNRVGNPTWPQFAILVKLRCLRSYDGFRFLRSLCLD